MTKIQGHVRVRLARDYRRYDCGWAWWRVSSNQLVPADSLRFNWSMRGEDLPYSKSLVFRWRNRAFWLRKLVSIDKVIVCVMPDQGTVSLWAAEIFRCLQSELELVCYCFVPILEVDLCSPSAHRRSDWWVRILFCLVLSSLVWQGSCVNSSCCCRSLERIV